MEIQHYLPGFEKILITENRKEPTDEIPIDLREDCFGRQRRIIETEFPDIVLEAQGLLDRLKTVEGYASLARGLTMAAMVGQGWRLKALATVAVDMAMDMGVTWHDYLKMLGPSRTKVIDLNQLHQIDAARGIAFIHGHFRMATPNSISTVAVAGEQAAQVGLDLMIGRESEERTRKYKTTEIVYPKEEIDDIFVDAGLCKWVLEIQDNIPYTDAGYQRLLSMINPVIYFSTNEYSEEVREERRLRAAKVGAEYRELDRGLPGKTTSDLLARGMLRDIKYKPFFVLPLIEFARWPTSGAIGKRWSRKASPYRRI